MNDIPNGPIELTDTELRLSFAASCIEGVARKLHRPYQEIYARMKRVNMIRDYLIPGYDVLHTQSREYVTDDVLDCLLTWEKKKNLLAQPSING